MYAFNSDLPPTVNLGLSLDHYTTTLNLAAPPDELADAVAAILARLAAPSPDALAHLASLLADDELPPATPLAHALLYRYGARGPGLQAFRCAGLHAYDPDHAVALAARAFARNNLAIATDGPPPEALRIALPDGARWVPAAPEACTMTYPVGYAHDSDTDIILTGTTAPGPVARASGRLLARRAGEVLRHASGTVYSPGGVHESFVGHDVVGVRTDVPPGSAAQVITMLFDEVTSLAAHGPTPAELDADRASLDRWLTDPDAPLGLPWGQASQHLLGAPVEGLAEIRESAEAVTGEQVRAAVDGLIDTMIVGVPGHTPIAVAALNWDKGPCNQPPPHSKTYKVRRSLGRRTPQTPEIRTVADIMWRGTETGVAVALDHVAAVHTWPDGARRIVRPDGYDLSFEPQLWTNGADLTAFVDAHVAPELVIHHPPRDPADLPVVPSLLERFLLSHSLWYGLFLAPVVVVIALLIPPTILGLILLTLALSVAGNKLVRALGTKPEAPTPPARPPAARLEHPASRVGELPASESNGVAA